MKTPAYWLKQRWVAAGDTANATGDEAKTIELVEGSALNVQLSQDSSAFGIYHFWLVVSLFSWLVALSLFVFRLQNRARSCSRQPHFLVCPTASRPALQRSPHRHHFFPTTVYSFQTADVWLWHHYLGLSLQFEGPHFPLNFNISRASPTEKEAVPRVALSQLATSAYICDILLTIPCEKSIRHIYSWLLSLSLSSSASFQLQAQTALFLL